MVEGEWIECVEFFWDEYLVDGVLKWVEEFKIQVNDYFKVKDYENVIKFYSQVIELNFSNVIYYGNCSLVYLCIECYGYVLGDVMWVIELDKKYIKGYYCWVVSNMVLGKFWVVL